MPSQLERDKLLTASAVPAKISGEIDLRGPSSHEKIGLGVVSLGRNVENTLPKALVL